VISTMSSASAAVLIAATIAVAVVANSTAAVAVGYCRQWANWGAS
jgi:hypothetical protein